MLLDTESRLFGQNTEPPICGSCAAYDASVGLSVAKICEAPTYYKFIVSDQNGAFLLSGLTPGEYKPTLVLYSTRQYHGSED